MKPETVVKKLIKKAIKGGWKGFIGCDWTVIGEKVIRFNDDGEYQNHYSTFVFNHDFAKALWGEEVITWDKWEKDTMDCNDIEECCLHRKGKPYWQFHLQQLVLSEDRIKYLSQFVKGGK